MLSVLSLRPIAMEPDPQPSSGIAEPPNSRPRYTNLQDYVRLVRRRKYLILGTTLVFALLGLGASLSQTKQYEATTVMSFRDIAQDVGALPGFSDTPTEAPGERAARNAELITRPEIAARVQKSLDSTLSPDSLAGMVTGDVGSTTNLVEVTATTSDPEFAAELANTFANEARKVGTAEVRGRLKRAIETLEDELKDARQSRGESPFPSGQETALANSISSIRTALAVAEPIQVLRPAATPSGQISPAPKRNTLIAGIVGLLFGLLGAFARDALDRRLRSVHDVHDETGLPVLGRVNEAAMAYPGLANGALMPDPEFEAFRVLRMNLAALSVDGVPPRTLLVTSGLADEGKSSVSMSLASAAAITGQSVLLIECDLRRPTLPKRLNIPRTPGLTDYLAGSAAPKDILKTVRLGAAKPTRSAPAAKQKTVGGKGADPKADAPKAAPAQPSLVVIPAGSPVENPAELLIGERFLDLLAKVSRAYDLVIVDSSPILAVVDPLEVAPHVDAVLVCARVQRTTREQARATRAALDGIAKPLPAGAVVTGLKHGDPDSYDYYYGDY